MIAISGVWIRLETRLVSSAQLNNNNSQLLLVLIGYFRVFISWSKRLKWSRWSARPIRGEQRWIDGTVPSEGESGDSEMSYSSIKWSSELLNDNRSTRHLSTSGPLIGCWGTAEEDDRIDDITTTTIYSEDSILRRWRKSSPSLPLLFHNQVEVNFLNEHTSSIRAPSRLFSSSASNASTASSSTSSSSGVVFFFSSYFYFCSWFLIYGRQHG